MNNINTVKVIVTCFIDRGVRQKDAKWYNHAQNLPNADSVLNMIKNSVKNEKQIDAGLPMDTVIVNNDNGYEPGKEFLNSIDGTKTKNGYFKVVHRPNVGRSYGAFSYAFDLFYEQYEHWIFQEDELYYSKNGYAKESLKILNNNKNCAFVATIGLGRPNVETTHAHGGCGLTHRSYLKETIPLEYTNTVEQAYKSKGTLPYYTGTSDEENKNTRLHCVYGEVPFTYSLIRLGYDILVPDNPTQWYSYWE